MVVRMVDEDPSYFITDGQIILLKFAHGMTGQPIMGLRMSFFNRTLGLVVNCTKELLKAPLAFLSRNGQNIGDALRLHLDVFKFMLDPQEGLNPPMEDRPVLAKSLVGMPVLSTHTDCRAPRDPDQIYSPTCIIQHGTYSRKPRPCPHCNDVQRKKGRYY